LRYSRKQGFGLTLRILGSSDLHIEQRQPPTILRPNMGWLME
jgi:hypothetical protein